MKSDDSQFDRPQPIAFEAFDDAEAAVARLELIYEIQTAFIRERFAALCQSPQGRGGRTPSARANKRSSASSRA